MNTVLNLPSSAPMFAHTGKCSKEAPSAQPPHASLCHSFDTIKLTTFLGKRLNKLTFAVSLAPAVCLFHFNYSSDGCFSLLQTLLASRFINDRQALLK